MLARFGRYSVSLSKVASPRHFERNFRNFTDLAQNTKERIEKLVKSGPVVVFMKGNCFGKPIGLLQVTGNTLKCRDFLLPNCLNLLFVLFSKSLKKLW